jgi:hypothetical protein
MVTCGGNITYTWTYSDCEGNAQDYVHTVTINDLTPPVITCPGNLTFECMGDVPAAFTNFADFLIGGGSASDNCGLDETSFTYTESDNGTCPRLITRTYSIADSCGNVSQCIQTITVDDITPPTITCPAGLTFECIEDLPAAFVTYADFVAGGGSASDNCGLDETTFTFSETDNGNCPRIIVRTYSIADSCGNVNQCMHTITVDDITPPIISCPPDLTIGSILDIPPIASTFTEFIIIGGNALIIVAWIQPLFLELRM